MNETGDPNTYRTVAQDIESAKKPFTQDDWREYYTPQQMTGGTRVQVFNQLPQAPVLTNPLGNTLLTNMYKFNGVPSVKEVKDDTTTIGTDSVGRVEIRTITGGSKTSKKRARRAFKSNRRTGKRRSKSSKKSIAKTGSKKKKNIPRVLAKQYSKMPPGLRKYWENKRKTEDK